MAEGAARKTVSKRLGRMIAELKYSDDFARAGILEKLASSPSKELVGCLALLLEEKNTAVRMDVLDTLRRIGNHNIKAVIGLLYGPHEDIRVYGCEVLQGLKNPLSLPHLVEAARDENENVKNAAVVALGEFDDPAAVDVLLDVLEQEEWVAFSAIYSLARIGNRRAAPALMDVFKNRGEELSLAACEALMRFGDDRIVDEIVEFIGSLEADKKRTFVRIVMEHGDGRIFGRLTGLMGEALLQQLLDYIGHEKRVSLKIIDLLAYFKCADSALALLDMLKEMEPDADEYGHILDLFMELREVWVPDIGRYLSVEGYRLPVIRACGAEGCHVDSGLLLGVFRSSPLAAKREIMKQLGRITNGNGNDIIREAMRDADGHIQAEAVAIAGSLPMRELTADVLRLAKSGYADVRVRALIALIRLDREAAVSTIGAFVTKGSAEDKRTYLAVTPHLDGGTNFPFLKRLIGDGDERVRQMAVRVVGNFIEDEKYLGLFRAVLESGDVPDEMLKVIGEKKLKGFKDVLVRILGDPLGALWTRYHALAALAVFKDPSLFSMFAGCLKDENNLIKIGGLKALAAIGDKRAIPRIRPFSKSIDEDLKAAATIVLERLSQAGELC
jgi:HEAT repeat protein